MSAVFNMRFVFVPVTEVMSRGIGGVVNDFYYDEDLFNNSIITGSRGLTRAFSFGGDVAKNTEFILGILNNTFISVKEYRKDVLKLVKLKDFAEAIGNSTLDKLTENNCSSYIGFHELSLGGKSVILPPLSDISLELAKEADRVLHTELSGVLAKYDGSTIYEALKKYNAERYSKR